MEIKPQPASAPAVSAQNEATAGETGQDAPKPQLESGSRWAGAVVLAVVAFMSAFLLWLGPYVQVRFGHDTGLYYSVAWKMYCGLRPSVDFPSPIGFLNFALVLAGMKLTGPNAACISTGCALFYVLVSALAWTACRRRFSPWLSGVFVLLAGLVAIRANALRLPFDHASYAAFYNRQGYAMLAVLIAQAFLPLRSNSRRLVAIDGAVFGGLVVVLFYWKITYFLCALGLLGAGICLGRFGPRWWCACLGGAVLALFPIAVYFHGNLLAYLQDLQSAAFARSGGLNASMALIEGGRALVSVLVLALFFVVSRSNGNWHSWFVFREMKAFFLPIVLVAGMSVCVILTNAPDGSLWDAPLFCFLALVLLQLAADRIRECDLDPRRTRVLGWLTAAVLAVPVGSGLGSLASCADWKIEFSPVYVKKGPHFDSPALSQLFVLNCGGNPIMPVTFCEEINDGVLLLKSGAPANATVETVDYTNWFPFALGWRPAPGASAWQAGFLQDENHCPPFDRAFAGADILMIPRFPGDYRTNRMLARVYKEEIARKYESVHISKCWALWKKKSVLKP